MQEKHLFVGDADGDGELAGSLSGLYVVEEEEECSSCLP